MKHVVLTLAALWELLRLGVLTRFRLSGPYWRWRMHTAFGRGLPEGGRWGMVKATLDYGRWVHQQRMSRP